MTLRCDALVVGGGPAGSTCAWALARAGFDVIVMDKSRFPRDKICAGWITPAVITALELDTEDYARGRVLQPIDSFRTGLVGGPQVETRFGETVSYGIRRCEFDTYLLARSGAQLRTGEPVRSLARVHGGWLVNEDIQTPVVIGAGGHFCPVARQLGNQPGARERIVAAQEIEFPLDESAANAIRVCGETPELYFCPDFKGYGWVFRKGNVLNVGLGHEDNHRLAERVSELSGYLRRHAKIPKDAPSRYKGHAYLLYGKSRRSLVDDGALLTGDAAGLAYDQSGEGIRTAVESGLLAAETLAHAGGDYTRAGLQDYEGRLRARFGPRPNGAGAADGKSPGTRRLRNYLGAKMLGNRWFSRHVVIKRWFLHTHQPALRI